MATQNYSLPEFCERYENVRFPLETALQSPSMATNGNGVRQIKNNHTFNINDRGAIYDIANGYFDISFKVERTDELTPAGSDRGVLVADHVALENGIHSLIKRITVKTQNGNNFYDVDNLDKAIHVKKLLEMSKDYADTVAENEFYYGIDKTNVTNVAGSPFVLRSALTSVATEATDPTVVNYRLPLAWYSAFQSMRLNNALLTGIQLKILVEIQNDMELLYSDTGLDTRLVLTKFELWLPQLTLRPQYATKYIEEITSGNPTTFYFNQERIEQYTSTSSQGTFKITGVVNPSKVIYFFVSNNRMNTQAASTHFFDSFFAGKQYPIGGTRTLNRCRLEVGSGQFYPQSDYLPSTEPSRLYSDLINYVHAVDDKSDGIQLTRGLFENLYSMLYFDLSYKRAPLISDSTELTFTYDLGGAGNIAQYTIYAFIEHEMKSSFTRLGGEFTLLSEVSKGV